MLDAVSKFLHHLEAAVGASPHTIRNYRLDLQAFLAFTKKDCTLGQITKQTIRAYLADLNLKGAKKRTILRRLSTLRSFYKYALRQKWVETSPLEAIDSPKLDKPLPKALNYQQIENLFNQPDTTTLLGLRDRAMLELFYSSGLRVSELAGINHSDLDYQNLRLRVRG
ncbi:MAG: site-specific integrase, partial [Chlamydiia bacterium]|nr:site-specific integrase [Chlamydiia bacterium]